MSSDLSKLTFGSTQSQNSSSTTSTSGQSQPSLSTLFGASAVGQPASSGLFGSGDASKPSGSQWSLSGFPASSAGGNNALSGATAENKQTGNSGPLATIASAPAFGSFGGSQTPSKPHFGSNESKSSFGGISAGGSFTSASPGSTTPALSGYSFNKPSTTPAGPPPINLFGGSTGGSNFLESMDKGKEKDKGASTPSLFQPPGTSAAMPSAGGSALSVGDQLKPPVPTFRWGKPFGTSQDTNPVTGVSAEPLKSLVSGLNQTTSDAARPSSAPIGSQKSWFGGLGSTVSNQPSLSAPSTSSAAPSFLAQPATSSADSGVPKMPQNLLASQSTTQSGTSADAKSKPPQGESTTQTSATSAPFSLFSKPATTSAHDSTGLNLSLGASTPSSSAPQAPTSSAPLTATTTAARFEGMFKTPGKPASASATASNSEPATSAAADTTKATTATAGETVSGSGASILGASTTGPVPHAQSRLRNKTMDEILTRWATDLTKYSKEFQSHAETVAHWDQLLVENMAKISKLYVSTVTAEKQTASVEMQLNALENQQNELESWLSKYEGEVDEMLSKDEAVGHSSMELGGPDLERERTYKLGERLGERLEDMTKDLTSMIEEINAANVVLGKTAKPDEPITQIVLILNSHLSQLQAIDQGTTALQAKINAAHQASRASGLGFPGMGMSVNGNGSRNGVGTSGGAGSGNGAVDDFYRSYMGRR